jgi:hypothetical protein
MQNKRKPFVLFALAAVSVAGCEHMTGTQPLVRTRPDLALEQSMTGLSAEELTMLLDLAERVQNEYARGERTFPAMGHPLEGLSQEQIHALFTAAGMNPDRYLPPHRPSSVASPGGTGDPR